MWRTRIGDGAYTGQDLGHRVEICIFVPVVP